MIIHHDEFFSGGKLPLRIPWHVMDVSRCDVPLVGVAIVLNPAGMNGGSISRAGVTKMNEFAWVDERRPTPSGHAY